MSDVELLEAVIRYGSQKRVAELMHVSPATVSVRFNRILASLDARVTQWEEAQARQDQSDLIADQQSRIADLERQLAQARQQIIKASREKPLAVEAQLREHTRGCPLIK
jgi:predicted transcriptional regulator